MSMSDFYEGTKIVLYITFTRCTNGGLPVHWCPGVLRLVGRANQAIPAPRTTTALLLRCLEVLVSTEPRGVNRGFVCGMSPPIER